jgi:hypothetical protein
VQKTISIEAYSTEEAEDIDMDLVQPDKGDEIPKISVHAISGHNAPNTMQLKGRMQSIPMTILLDSGSSHNFISASFAH